MLAVAWVRLPRYKAGPGPLQALAQGAALWLAAVLAGVLVPAVAGAARAFVTGALPCFKLWAAPRCMHVLSEKRALLNPSHQSVLSVVCGGEDMHGVSCMQEVWLHPTLIDLLCARACAGKPVIWFGRNALAAACYAPLALAGLLLPYAAFPAAAAARLDAAVAGVALVQALTAAALTWAGAKSGFAFALWAACAAAGLLAPRKVPPRSISLSFMPLLTALHL